MSFLTGVVLMNCPIWPCPVWIAAGVGLVVGVAAGYYAGKKSASS